MQEVDSVINSDEEENEEELLVQYGIASEEQYEKALDMQIFKENFCIHHLMMFQNLILQIVY